MSKKKFSATLFFPAEKQIRPRKYRNITLLANFSRFAANSGAAYINLYDQETGHYLRRIKLLS